MRDGKKLVHEGIKVEFVGSIGMQACYIILKQYMNLPIRIILRPRASPGIPLTIAGTSCSRGDAAGTDV